MLTFFPQGLSHLLFPHLASLFRHIYDDCTFVLLAFWKRFVWFTIFTFIMSKIDSIWTFRIYLSFCNSRMIGKSSTAVLDHTGNCINFFFHEHSVSSALIFELIKVVSQLIDFLNNSFFCPFSHSSSISIDQLHTYLHLFIDLLPHSIFQCFHIKFKRSWTLSIRFHLVND